MLRAICFNDKRYNAHEDFNLMSPLTENTIILCGYPELMKSLAAEIVNTINGSAEYNDYDCDDADIGKARFVPGTTLREVIDINGQRITLCLEPAMIYTAKTAEDIWFCDDNDDCRTSIWPLTIFKGAQEVWNMGLDEVYNRVASGHFGCFDIDRALGRGEIM